MNDKLGFVIFLIGILILLLLWKWTSSLYKVEEFDKCDVNVKYIIRNGRHIKCMNYKSPNM